MHFQVPLHFQSGFFCSHEMHALYNLIMEHGMITMEQVNANPLTCTNLKNVEQMYSCLADSFTKEAKSDQASSRSGPCLSCIPNRPFLLKLIIIKPMIGTRSTMLV